MRVQAYSHLISLVVTTCFHLIGQLGSPSNHHTWGGPNNTLLKKVGNKHENNYVNDGQKLCLALNITMFNTS